MKKMELYDPYANFKHSELANGLNVYSLYVDRPYLKVGFVVHSGSLIDPAGKAGMSHFVEHLLGNNIPSMSFSEVLLFFELGGGGVNLGMTYPSTTEFCFNIPLEKKALRNALIIFGNMLFDSSIKEHIEDQRKIVLNEFNQEYVRGFSYEIDWIKKQSQIFKGSELSKFKGSLGTPETINSITKKDLQAFYRKNYIPQNISVVLVGGLSHKGFVNLLKGSAFAEKRQGTRNPLPQKSSHLDLPDEQSFNLKLSEYFGSNACFNVATSTTYVGVPGITKLDVIIIFRSMLNKILFREVREKRNSAYHFAMKFINWNSDYEFIIGTMINPDIAGNIDGVINQCLDEVASNRKLFQERKTVLLNDLYMHDVSDEIIRGNAMGSLQERHGITSLKEDMENLDAVTFDDIRSLAAYVMEPQRKFRKYSSP